MPEADDLELLRRWSGGDTDAGGRLLRRHFPLVYRFFVTKLDDRPDDLVQQTFLACVSAAQRFESSRGSFRAFLLGIARNELLAFRRKAHRADRALRGNATALPASFGSPSGPVALREELKVLLRALRTLPSELQIVLELYYWEELAVADLAEITAVPPGTVKSRLARGRRLLREAIIGADASDAVRRSTADNFEAWAQALRERLTEAASDSAP